jgi:hypothetical protein
MKITEINSFGQNIVDIIFVDLSIADLSHLMLCCKSIYSAIEENSYLWRAKYIQKEKCPICRESEIRATEVTVRSKLIRIKY